MQSKRDSWIEICTNTFIGMCGSWLITLIVLYTIDDKVTASIASVILCTIWSLARGYTVRRYFNNRGSVQT